MEANANRYTYIWKKSVQGNQEKLKRAIRELLQQIEAVMQEENTQYGDRDLPDIEPQPLIAEALAAQLAQWEDRLRPQAGAPLLKKLHQDSLPVSRNMSNTKKSSGIGTASARPIRMLPSCA